jgi:hypothetical protein
MPAWQHRDDYEDDNKPVFTTWAVGALFRGARCIQHRAPWAQRAAPLNLGDLPWARIQISYREVRRAETWTLFTLCPQRTA